MHRTLGFIALLYASVASADRVLGQAKWTEAQKIANAATAAPAFISENATIMEWQNGKAVTLRAGTNGWTCVPTDPAKEGNDPMCADGERMAFMTALKAQATPHVERVGIGYVIAPGRPPRRKTDPL